MSRARIRQVLGTFDVTEMREMSNLQDLLLAAASVKLLDRYLAELTIESDDR